MMSLTAARLLSPARVTLRSAALAPRSGQLNVLLATLAASVAAATSVLASALILRLRRGSARTRQRPAIKRLSVIAEESACLAPLASPVVVHAELTGFAPPNSPPVVVQDLRWMVTKSPREFFRFLRGGHVLESFAALSNSVLRGTQCEMGDARVLQRLEMEEQGMSAADFFAKHGFILVKHRTAMTAADWQHSDVDLKEHPGEGETAARDEKYMTADTPVRRIWSHEAEAILQSLIPEAASFELPSFGFLRKSANGIFSGKGASRTVHNDLPLDLDKACNRAKRLVPRMGQQRELLETCDYSSLLVCNLWRPIAPSTKPVESAPLCVCDAKSVTAEDFVEHNIGALDDPRATQITGLKHNARQRWYYYPAMTTEEVLVFRQFQHVKGDAAATMPAFHTAFRDPASPEAAEPRISFEYRVGVLTR